MCIREELKKAYADFRKNDYRQEKELQNINISMYDPLFSQMNKIAFQNNVSRSLLIRVAVQKFLNERG